MFKKIAQILCMIALITVAFIFSIWFAEYTGNREMLELLDYVYARALESGILILILVRKYPYVFVAIISLAILLWPKRKTH